MTTLSESAEVHTSKPAGVEVGPNVQTQAHARARLAPSKLTERVRAGRQPNVSQPGPKARAKVRVSPFHSAPASVADVIAYTRSGDWVPGEQARVLEAAGKAYGWVIAVPLSIAAYALVWVLQRPARAFLAAAVGAVMAAMLPARTFAGGLPLALAVATVTAAVITHTPGKEGTS